MSQHDPVAEARRIFLITVVVRAAFIVLGLLASAAVAPTSRLLALMFLPTAAVLLLAFLTYLNRLLGSRYLVVPLLVDATFMSLRGAPLLVWHVLRGSEAEITLAHQALSEPFTFTLIPLVLLAWAYGRRGALWGALWVTIIQFIVALLTVIYVPGEDARNFAIAITRTGILWAVPYIVSALAQRLQQRMRELEDAHQQLQRHASTVEQLAVSRERNRMARDLHDTLAHSLAALTIHLGAVRTLIDHDTDAAKSAVNEARDMARNGLEESREAIHALREDPVQTMGLVPAVRAELEAFHIRTGIEAHLAVAGDVCELTEAQEGVFFRIVYEALTNIERHAQATIVTVRCAYGFDRIEISIEDNGRGFSSETVGDEHFGLLGMRERANIINATLTVDSQPGTGTVIRCALEA